jgi:hypothetical protein
MPQTIYVGLDLGSSRCQQTVINSDGTIAFSRIVPTSEHHLRSAFTGLGGGASVHLESGELAAWARSIQIVTRTGIKTTRKKDELSGGCRRDTLHGRFKSEVPNS